MSIIPEPRSQRRSAASHGRPLADFVLYEVHVGAFTPEGTFAAAIGRLDELVDLGITAVELMPVAQFPGQRNWGYDGVYPYAVQDSYGGPAGLKSFVDACHDRGLAVVLDVVYNRFGPEGAYAADFGPYHTERYRTPWGRAVNFDDAHSDAVRDYFVGNALHWLGDYHLDALRLDAVHAIFDASARPFLGELAAAVHARFGEEPWPRYLIAESDLNDSRLIRRGEQGGLGLDAQWADDLHHALHVLLTREQSGYYADFGGTEGLVAALRQGWAYTGQYSVARQRSHGNDPGDLPTDRFVVSGQNHDQVGNRRRGERLATLVGFEGLKLAAGCVLLSRYLPLLFMGEEYGEENPFLYFVDHSDPGLRQAVRRGRAEEHAAFLGQGETPDPCALETFLASKLEWSRRGTGRQALLLRHYRTLTNIRRTHPALRPGPRRRQRVERHGEDVVAARYGDEGESVLCLYNFATASSPVTVEEDGWRRLLDSADREWQGPGSLLPTQITAAPVCLLLPPQSCAAFARGPR
ncbi:MAG: malto-oligosyltrehalose trehalohydrolase [Candidatus Latescibacterota bacterium]